MAHSEKIGPYPDFEVPQNRSSSVKQVNAYFWHRRRVRDILN